MATRLLKLVISLLVASVDAVAGGISRILGTTRPTPCVVLYYHAVRPEFRAKFAWQMAQLSRTTTPVDIAANEFPKSARRYSAVTFDDAFMSVVENALPELDRHRIPCVIFVPTGSLGGNPRWIPTEHPDSTELVAAADIVNLIANRPLIRIGSHSVSHPDFRRLDDDRARHELSASKDALERIIGKAVTLFSFPHGAHTERSLELVRQCGYSHAFTIEPQRMTQVHEAFSIGRVRVEPSDWRVEFRLKVVGAYRWMVRASLLKRRLRAILGMTGGDRAVRGA